MKLAALNQIAVLASADLAAAEVALRGIPNDDPDGTFVPYVLDRIRSGKAKLCELRCNGEHIGHSVYEIELFGSHREFVSVATRCPQTRGIVVDLGKVLEQLARNENCQTIRMHTVRHGLVNEALKHGWHVAEIVLRKQVIQ